MLHQLFRQKQREYEKEKNTHRNSSKEHIIGIRNGNKIDWSCKNMKQL